jgi:S1-C subfamily serine protease
MTATRIASIVALLALLLAAFGCPNRADREVEEQVAVERLGSAGSPIADVAERSVESVVNISSQKVIRGPAGDPFGPFFDDPFFRQFFGDRFRFPQVPRERRERSLGSGVIVSEGSRTTTWWRTRRTCALR